ncbi:MAG TPA: ATP-binding protein [Azospirillaceae bacterium]|nr:ATP-binding protein [Azospirillaceae bacterium]
MAHEAQYRAFPAGAASYAAGAAAVLGAGAGLLCALVPGLGPLSVAGALVAGGAGVALAVQNARLRHAAERVAESERKYRDIFENAVEGVFTTSVGGRFLSANPAMARMLGYGDADELIACLTDTASQLYMDPERRHEFARRILAEGAVQAFESQVRRRDGTPIWISVSARAVRAADGGVVAFQGTAEDVTARRQAEEALVKAKEQSEFANRAKTEFLANMSHELRTPLNAIIGFSEIIGSQSLGPIDNPDYAEYARDIHESGRMLLDLINDILDLSKIEAGRKELNEHMVDLPRAMGSCLRLVKERAIRGGVTTALDVAEPLPRLRADEIALKQVLSNLLTNAVKFTPKGGSVTLSARVQPDGRLLVSVADTGIGIHPEDIPKAMEPFRQIEGPLTRSAGGAGLGLPLVRALVELHGGSFALESEPGRGTTAKVWLPADRLLPEPAAVAARAL